jgi:signal transduction histidine kinase
LRLNGDTLIVDAARRSLERSAELLYEPIVVELEAGCYRLLDAHQLLVAQSKIHELATQMLNEQTQAQLMQTEKMASLGQMVASVAHEIKNPVGCITCNFEFLSNYCNKLIEVLAAYETEVSEISVSLAELKEEAELDFILEDLPKILKSIEVGSDRLTKIVGGLQNFSHMDENHRKPADIHECIESTLIILNNRLKSGIQVIKNYGYLPPVNCYSGQLSQVFMNIISNAIDALIDKVNERGTSSKTWQPQVEISTTVVEHSDAEWVSIRIADNGPGISPAIQKRIFETFFTTKPVGKGTGLGLAISHQIVTQKHGGQLLMRSQPETGTEFQILLPLI